MKKLKKAASYLGKTLVLSMVLVSFLSSAPAQAAGVGKVMALIDQRLAELGITSGGSYSAPTLATVLASGADGNQVSQTNLGSLTLASGKTLTVPSLTNSTGDLTISNTAGASALNLSASNIAVVASGVALPTASKITWNGDTTLYRSAAGTLAASTTGASVDGVVTARDVNVGRYLASNGASGACTVYGLNYNQNDRTTDLSLGVYSGSTVTTNLGASATVTCTWPAVATGCRGPLVFVVRAAQELRIDPQGTDKIIDIDMTGLVDGEYITSSTVGSTITLIQNSDGDLVVVGKTGTWTEETP